MWSETEFKSPSRRRGERERESEREREREKGREGGREGGGGEKGGIERAPQNSGGPCFLGTGCNAPCSHLKLLFCAMDSHVLLEGSVLRWPLCRL